VELKPHELEAILEGKADWRRRGSSWMRWGPQPGVTARSGPSNGGERRRDRIFCSSEIWKLTCMVTILMRGRINSRHVGGAGLRFMRTAG